MASSTNLEFSTFQRRPAYRYIRAADRLPTIDEIGSRGLDEVACPIKLFNPTGRGSWFIAAYDPETRLAWGVADIYEREAGPIDMAELVDFRGRFGLPIERDLHYSPQTVTELLRGSGELGDGMEMALEHSPSVDVGQEVAR
jgi:Protein of unknown function (DUF2958)